MSFQEEIKELLAKYSQVESETEQGEVTDSEDQTVAFRSAEEEPSGSEDLASVDTDDSEKEEIKESEEPDSEESEEELEIKGSPEGEIEEPVSEEKADEPPADFGLAIEKVSKTVEELLERIDRLESARVRAAGGAESKTIEVENQDWLNKLF